MSLLNSLEIEEIVNKNKSHSSAFVFHHLPSDTGITIGNFLRRILLNHVSSTAIMGVEISDKNGPVETEFAASWEGIDKPIPIYLIIKLQEIVLVEKKPREGIFVLEMDITNDTKKERVIVAGDFSKIKEVEIKNPELELATLSPGGKLSLKLYCQKSWGYREVKEKEDQEEAKKKIKDYFPEAKDSVIILDTDYSPVKLVNSQMGEVVISSTSKEEKLTLTIDTNGAITPKKALQEALEISQDSFSRIFQLINDSDKAAIKKKKGELSSEPTAEEIKKVKI